MIITKEALIILNSSNISFYKKLGYIIPDKPAGKAILVSIDDITKSSHIVIDVSCDYCYSIKSVTYKEYNRNIKYNNKFSCSNKCGAIKRKELSIVKYGVESPSMLNIVKDKNKVTCNKKYNKDYYMNTKEFRDKSNISMLVKYGVENAMHSEEIKEKLKESILDKYGVENVFQSIFIKDKIKNTNIEKFGFEHYSKTKEFKIKCRETNLERYGVDSYSKTEESKSRVIKMNLEKWGVESYMSTEDFKKKSKKFFMDKFGVDFATQSEEIRKSINKNCKDKNYIKYLGDFTSLYDCERGHSFKISSDNYHSRLNNNIPLCTVCNPIGDSQSIKEKEFFEFIRDIYKDEIIQSYRDGLEIDIYLPELKIGFEFNGLYWHSEKYKDKNYHIDKTNYFKEKGIRIIHIWEDDWNFKRDIVKAQVINIIGINLNKIYARKCKVIEVGVSECREFMDENHIQGFVKSNIKLGLYYEGILVSIMTFDHYEGRKKMDDISWNLNRFCSKKEFNIVGGASKLLKYFIRNYNPKRIISYADLDWSNGDLYYKLGFNLIDITTSDYKYLVNGKRIHKSRYRKSRLGTSDKLTESLIMGKRNINKIWNCGKMKFEFFPNIVK